jgi:hypothetical protein
VFDRLKLTLLAICIDIASLWAYPKPSHSSLSLIHRLCEIGRESKCIAWVIASRSTWCLCFAVYFACYSWWLPPPRWLGAARIIERRKMLSSAPIVVIVRGSWSFPSGEPKVTLVDCSWLVWSSSCVDCVSPYWGFRMWCQLAREPPSEWITTMRTSLLASKWTSIKNLVSSLSEDFIGFHCDWLALLVIGSVLYMAV